MRTFELKREHFIYTGLTSLLIVAAVKLIAPSVIPFTLMHFWAMHGSLEEAIVKAWPLFAWGAGVTAMVAFTTRNHPMDNRLAEDHLARGILISVWAGVAEEICFRWLIFFSAIVTMQGLNLLFLFAFHFPFPEWFYTNVIGPIADFCTLHYLHDILFNGYGWAVGAAVIASNGQFRNGHAYQGLFGMTNSWFCGMFFFWAMFNYGLPAAIMIHLLYDLFIFVVGYVDRVFERTFLAG